MYSYVQVMNGVTKYIDNEIVNNITGWQKWVVGAGIGVALNKSTNIFNELKSNTMVKTLEIIDKEDNIDVDTLYKEFSKQAEKEAITFNVPIIGIMTLNKSDVDSLYRYIKEN